MPSCPNCEESALEPARVGAEQVDRCGRCGGVFFSRGKARLFESEDAHRRLVVNARYAIGRCARSAHPMSRVADACPHCASRPARCPGCKALLAALPLRGAQIDVCSSCEGIWLDQAELGLLIGNAHVVLEGGAAPPPVVAAPPTRERPKCSVCSTELQLSSAWVRDDSLFCHRCAPGSAKPLRALESAASSASSAGTTLDAAEVALDAVDLASTLFS